MKQDENRFLGLHERGFEEPKNMHNVGVWKEIEEKWGFWENNDVKDSLSLSLSLSLSQVGHNVSIYKDKLWFLRPLDCFRAS